MFSQKRTVLLVVLIFAISLLVGCVLFPGPTARITVHPPEPRAGEKVILSGESSGGWALPDNDTTSSKFIGKWCWTIDEEGPLCFKTPELEISEGFSAGKHKIFLEVTDWRSCKTATATKVITVFGPPIAQIDADPLRGEAPLTVKFDASGSYDPDGGELDYRWEFEGCSGCVSDSKNPVYTFKEAGEYCVTLKVTDDEGDTATAKIVITVTAKPEERNKPPVAVASASPREVKVGEMVWFDGSGSYDPDGRIVKWHWDFGDHHTSNIRSPIHEYTQEGSFTATLIVTDNDGASDKDWVTVKVVKPPPPPPPPPNQPPVARFSALPTSGEAPLKVDFDASASYDPDGEIVSYEWDFGDGSTGSGVTESHTYDSKGTYTVTLTVIDDDSAQDSESQEIRVKAPPPLLPPPSPPTLNVSFWAEPSGGYAPLTVDLVVEVSGSAQGDIVYQLSCGEDNGWDRRIVTDSEYYRAEKLCTYEEPGTYSARVKVEREGQTVEGNTTIVVVAGQT